MAATGLGEQKAQLRKTVRAEVAKLTNEEIELQSRSVLEQVAGSPEYQRARAISIFLSMPGKEVPTIGILREAFRSDKAVFVPYIYTTDGARSKDKVMDMLRLQDESDFFSLKPDAWGIPSMGTDSVSRRENALGGFGIQSAVCAPQLDLIFVPGVAFDLSNRRLGHGRGFYDRYLERYRSTAGQTGAKMPSLVGLALSPQLLPEGATVPVDEHDWLVDQVITPK